MDKKDESKKKPAEKPISLAPLKFEEAVEGLLKVKAPGKRGARSLNEVENHAQDKD